LTLTEQVTNLFRRFGRFQEKRITLKNFHSVSHPEAPPFPTLQKFEEEPRCRPQPKAMLTRIVVVNNAKANELLTPTIR
jgi:hypothetical protein